MNMIEQLVSRLRREYPRAKVKLDIPKEKSGVWWLDFSSGPNSAEIEWRPDSDERRHAEGLEQAGARETAAWYRAQGMLATRDRKG